MNSKQGSPRSSSCRIDHSAFDHFLLTRFAVYGPHGQLPSDAWLHDRFKLFEDFCLPSVKNQTCRNFSWGLLVSPGLPKWAHERLLMLGLTDDNLVVSHDWRSASAATAWILQHAEKDSILTTRLDNDDALATTFVERLHAKVQPRDVGAYNFAHGLQSTPKGLLFSFQNSNPFLSLLERTDVRTQTILALDHDLVGQTWPVRQIRGGPAWLQVVHENNLANAANGIPAGKFWATRRFILPYPTHGYRLASYVRDIRPFRVLARRIRRKLVRG